VVLTALAGAPGAAAGQDPVADSTRADSVAADSLPDGAVATDTLPGDTIPRDTLPQDSVPPDTLPGGARRDSAAADSAGAELDQVREGLAGGGFPQRDSTFRRLAEESGYRIVEYRGRDVALEVPDRRIVLRDSAQANYGEAALRADSITYRSRLQFISARGNIRLVSPDQREMTTDSVLYYDVSRLKGTVLSANTTFAARGAEWRVQGDAVPVGDRTLYVNRGTFTSCDVADPHYFFRAGQIKMVSRDVIVAWPVTLYIADVPVIWLPFFAQDIRPERRSGILPPQFGFNDIVSTSDNVQRQIDGTGYYWAINRFMDAKFTTDWFSGDFTRLNGNFRYNFMKSFIEGDVRVSQEWGEAGRNFRVDARHRQDLSPDTRFEADVEYVQRERLLRDRSFEPDEQTQTIDSDVGLDHDFGFGNLSLSARRQQFLGTAGRVDQTLPQLSASFSPVTLFEAPRNRAGFFNNLTFSPGALNFRRQDQTRDLGDDRLTTSASIGPSLRVDDLSLSTSASFSETETTPFRAVVDPASGDTAALVNLDPRLQSTLRWNASADYQVELMGSTTLRPDVEVSGSWFRSRTPPDTIRGDTVPDTDGAFVQAPTRVNVGASLSTDLFGFLPGFGPFSRIRHKISPRFRWRYSPEVTLSDPDLGEIPGFPGGTGDEENTLSVSLNQTFEAKMTEEGRDGEDEGDGGGDDGPDGQGGEGAADGAQDGPAGGAAPAPGRERKVTLLSIRSDALRFDFNRPGPALVTDRFRNSISSDLFSGLDLTIEHDLFEGTGEDRTFSPFLAQLNASFSLRSGQSLGDLLGLGGGSGGGFGAPSRGPARGRPGEGRHEAGPWNLSLSYSLRRRRDDPDPGSVFGGGDDQQSISGNISLQPTPNWEMRWSTQYSFTDNEFGAHNVQLTRNLHRWRAQFSFQKAPNGNFIFRFFVSLVDAPELKVDYDQRSQTVP
jgi:hypothetical protein